MGLCANGGKGAVIVDMLEARPFIPLFIGGSSLNLRSSVVAKGYKAV